MITEKVGIANIEMTGEQRYKLLNDLIKSSISIKDMTDAGSTISGQVDISKLRKLKKLCDKYGVELKVTDEKGLAVSGRRFYKHLGIPAGLIVAAVIMFYLSNIVLHIRIIGADYDTRQDIYAVLEDFGIGEGTPVSDIDFHRIETALTDNTNSVAWAGLRFSNSELVINISQEKKKPDITEKRYPANIVASRDAVITGFQVYCGSIDFMMGDGVAKGQILISGEYTDRNGKLRYRYSQASITGKFADTQTFFEPYVSVEKTISENAEERSFFRFFDNNIRLFSSEPSGKYIEHERVQYFNFLGVELPVGITHISYDSYSYETVSRSEEEVRTALEKDIENYEKNFLSDDEIIEKNVGYTVSEEGITATVYYVAEGEIGETQIIFPKKS